MRTLLSPIAAVSVLSLALPGAAAGAEKAGVSAAVRGSVALTRESQRVVGRQLESGEDIFLRDLIESGPRSGMQIMLLDETVFTIGPGSAIEIDEFVYDPASDAGEVSAEVVKGMFRFVTGKVARREPEAMNVRLPVGNIGIRGTMVAGIVRPDTSALVFLLGTGPDNDSGQQAGAFVAENQGVSHWVRRPGWGAEFHPGEPPRIVEVDPRLIAEITGMLNDPSMPPPDDTAPGRFAERLGQSLRGDLGSLPEFGADPSGRAAAAGLGLAAVAGDLLDAADGFGSAAVDATQSALDQQSDIATVEALLAIPTGSASYTGAGQLSDGGSYDFDIRLDFSDMALSTDFSNIVSPDLGLSDQATYGGASVDTGIGGFADYLLAGQPISDQGSCIAGCPVVIRALFFDTSSPPAESAHRIDIFAPATGGHVWGQESGVPQAPTKR